MSNPLDGSTKPALSEIGEKEPKTKTYKTPNGEEFQITAEEFAQVVAIFDFLRQSRDEKNTRVGIEPEQTATQSNNDPVNYRKVG